MAYVLALDAGTTSVRSIIFDETGRVVTTAQQEFPQYFPQPGWVEHNADEIWQAQWQTARAALQQARLVPSSIAAVGITNQRETIVVWDRATGRPITPAIVWQDRRTAGECDRLKARGHEADVTARTGLVLDPYFSGTKLAWILDHVPEARARAERGELACGTIDTWLAWQLTGGRLHITDPSNASRTLLYNIHQHAWDAKLLELWHIPQSLLPEVRSSSEVYGTITAEGLLGIPLAGIAGDQQAALFGQLCTQSGLTKNTYGTGCFMLRCTGQHPVASRQKLITTVAWQRGKEWTYALEGSVFIGGAVVQWLRDGLGLIRSAAEVETLAATVSDNGGVYLVPAFAGLGAPHWDAYARGAMVGLTRGSSAGHIARAALESIAYQVADLADAMTRDAAEPLQELRVDGGGSCNEFLMQFQADLLGVPVVRPEVTETTALGAAFLAGLATGVWTETTQLEHRPQAVRRYEPQGRADVVAALRAKWHRAVARAADWDERPA